MGSICFTYGRLLQLHMVPAVFGLPSSHGGTDMALVGASLNSIRYAGGAEVLFFTSDFVRGEVQDARPAVPAIRYVGAGSAHIVYHGK